MHVVDEKPADDDATHAGDVRNMVAAAGSTEKALAHAAEEEEQLKLERAYAISEARKLKKQLLEQRQLVARETAAQTTNVLQQEVELQQAKHERLLAQLVAEEYAKARGSTETDATSADKLTQVEVQEDPADLIKCIEDLQKGTGKFASVQVM